jgi:hypothetical protein
MATDRRRHYIRFTSSRIAVHKQSFLHALHVMPKKTGDLVGDTGNFSRRMIFLVSNERRFLEIFQEEVKMQVYWSLENTSFKLRPA